MYGQVGHTQQTNGGKNADKLIKFQGCAYNFVYRVKTDTKNKLFKLLLDGFPLHSHSAI